MTKAMMAYPELRHPFEATEIHSGGSVEVLYQGRVTSLEGARSGASLLIRPDDLTRVSGFELKPEGACHEDTCIPLPSGMLVDKDDVQWFDLSAFADHLGQAYVADAETSVWSFAEMPLKRESMLVDAIAPDFAVKDRQGRLVSKDSLKGKKAMIVTWASW